MRRPLLILLAATVGACGGGSDSQSSPPPKTRTLFATEAGTSSAGYAGTGICPADTHLCSEDSGYCCDDGSACRENTANSWGCGASYEWCCLSCAGGAPCGAGCCAAGTVCTATPDGLRCTPPAEEPACPPDVESACPAGTECLYNRSAKSCSENFACYHHTGVVACPGDVACPNGTDFCPSNTVCTSTGGVCNGSSSGNYCCKVPAAVGESCDSAPCGPGLSCVAQNYCPESDPSAATVCKVTTCGEVDCGNYCCPASYPVCDVDCWCWQ